MKKAVSLIVALDMLRFLAGLNGNMRFNAQSYKATLGTGNKTPETILNELHADARIYLSRIKMIEDKYSDKDALDTLNTALDNLCVEDFTEIQITIDELKKVAMNLQDTTIENIVEKSDELLTDLKPIDKLWER